MFKGLIFGMLQQKRLKNQSQVIHSYTQESNRLFGPKKGPKNAMSRYFTLEWVKVHGNLENKGSAHEEVL